MYNRSVVPVQEKSLGLNRLAIKKLVRNCSFSLSLTLLFGLTAYLHAAEKPVLNITETKLASVPEGYDVRKIVLSPDKQKTAHILFKKDKKGKKDKFYVFFDGRLSKPYDRVKDVVFSPDGKRMVYAAKKGEKEYFVIDGKESKPYASV